MITTLKARVFQEISLTSQCNCGKYLSRELEHIVLLDEKWWIEIVVMVEVIVELKERV